MKALLAQWAQGAARFAALTLRERAIVAAAVVLGGGFLIFNFGVDPFLVKGRLASKALAAATTEQAQQQVQLTILTTASIDPDAANRQRLAQLKEQLGTVSERLARFEEGMVPPSRMQGFLEGLLARKKKIEVMGMKTLPVTVIGAPAAADKPPASVAQAAEVAKNPGSAFKPDAPASPMAAAPEGIYQHGIELRLVGSYNDLLDYLTELERLPQRVMWNSVALTAREYPKNELVLRVYTLSLDKNWMVM